LDEKADLPNGGWSNPWELQQVIIRDVCHFRYRRVAATKVLQDAGLNTELQKLDRKEILVWQSHPHDIALGY
jgi:hypothetical protein